VDHLTRNEKERTAEYSFWLDFILMARIYKYKLTNLTKSIQET
jgi:hypothetical protein